MYVIEFRSIRPETANAVQRYEVWKRAGIGRISTIAGTCRQCKRMSSSRKKRFSSWSVKIKRKRFSKSCRDKMSSTSSSQEDIQRAQSPSFLSTAFIFPRVNGHQLQKQAAVSTLTLLTGAHSLDYAELQGSGKSGKQHTSPKRGGATMTGRSRATSDASGVQEQHSKGHTFVIQNFKKATFCDCCQRLLLDYQRQGLRCRVCKLNIHENCLANIGFCNGRPLGTFGFSRRPPSEASQESLQRDPSVDSVYKILQQGRVLRMSDNPGDILTNEIRSTTGSPVPETPQCGGKATGESCGTNLTTPATSSGTIASSATFTTGRKEKTSTTDGRYIYIAMYKFEPREKDDLPLRVGDKINVIKDKDDAWWLGECQNKTGYFPAKFVARMRPHESAYTANKIIVTNDSMGKDMTIKKNQVIFVNPNWPVKRENYLYCRVGTKEGHVQMSDITPVHV